MSATTRSFAPRLIACAFAGIVAVATSATVAPRLPEAAATLLPGASLRGTGELTWFGLPIYDAYYWSSERVYDPRRAFALDLHYRHALDGDRIAQRSSDEIARLGFGSASERQRWGELMKRLFPDVRKGDSIVGVNVPGEGVRFFHNGAPIGGVDDARFAEAFFAIWFDARTSRPDFRRQLLGAQ